MYRFIYSSLSIWLQITGITGFFYIITNNSGIFSFLCLPFLLLSSLHIFFIFIFCVCHDILQDLSSFSRESAFSFLLSLSLSAMIFLESPGNITFWFSPFNLQCSGVLHHFCIMQRDQNSSLCYHLLD